MLNRADHNILSRIHLRQPRVVLDRHTLLGLLHRVDGGYRGEIIRPSDDAPLLAALIRDYARLKDAETAMWERRQSKSVGSTCLCWLVDPHSEGGDGFREWGSCT